MTSGFYQVLETGDIIFYAYKLIYNQFLKNKVLCFSSYHIYVHSTEAQFTPYVIQAKRNLKGLVSIYDLKS